MSNQPGVATCWVRGRGTGWGTGAATGVVIFNRLGPSKRRSTLSFNKNYGPRAPVAPLLYLWNYHPWYVLCRLRNTRILTLHTNYGATASYFRRLAQAIALRTARNVRLYLVLVRFNSR